MSINKNNVIGENVSFSKTSQIGNFNVISDGVVLNDNVVVGSGAQILGPIVVGKNSKIGANAVVTKNVPENAIMVGIPAKNVGMTSEEFKPYGISNGDEK